MSEASNKPRVLIVDDEAPIRELLAQMLSDDCVCVTSESAEAAIREINGTAFDLVISDVHLGGMSGVELVPMVQKKSPDTVVMMISGAQSVDTAIDAIRVGVFDYIRKPFDFDQVIAAVKRAVQHQRLLAEKHRRTLELQTLVENHTAELHSLAFRDALTGLPNDAMFVQLLSDTLAGYGLRQKTAVLMVRILNLRSVRDSIGLAAANEVLLEATRRLKEVTKKDILSRFEASTFAVAISQTDPSLVTDAVNLICRRLEPSFVIGRRDIYLKPAIGVSLFPGDGTDADTLIRNAGAALSRAEVENVGYRFYAPEINAQAVRQLSLENNLRRALDRNEFTVFYQPKVDIESRRVTGMEALLRWNSSELGIVPPDVFIPVAESTDLIVPIGEWSVRAVCEQTKAWCEQGFDLNVAVNLSARQFRDPTLSNKIWATLIETGLDPHSLTLEVTETSVLTDRELAVKTLTSLQKLGINIAIDDFGTGQSSLGYLRSLPIDILKIDKSFVDAITTDDEAAILVKAMITLARDLRLRVVAEGVESSDQLELLASFGCDEWQGYLYSEPLPAGEFISLLRTANAEGSIARFNEARGLRKRSPSEP